MTSSLLICLQRLIAFAKEENIAQCKHYIANTFCMTKKIKTASIILAYVTIISGKCWRNNTDGWERRSDVWTRGFPWHVARHGGVCEIGFNEEYWSQQFQLRANRSRVIDRPNKAGSKSGGVSSESESEEIKGFLHETWHSYHSLQPFRFAWSTLG